MVRVKLRGVAMKESKREMGTSGGNEVKEAKREKRTSHTRRK